MQITLDSTLALPIYRQVFVAIQQAILDGTLKPGQRLPASRQLCESLNVSRNTILAACDMLKAEGYLEAKQGSGLYVSVDPPDSYPPTHSNASSSAQTVNLSKRGEELARSSRPVPDLAITAFVPGLPDIAEFPFHLWHQCVQQTSRKPSKNLLRYQDQGGLLDLKIALRNYLKLFRGVNCTESQIVVVNGSQAGLDLITRALIDPGEYVAVEDPGYLGARDGFRAAGAQLISIGVDEEGLNVDELEQQLTEKNAKIKLIYTTPSDQFPLGSTLNLTRRLRLLELAKKHNFCIIEDDYDSEFRYNQRPITSLQGLDTEQRVIYMGTFSKVMFPGLRMGYIVAPNNLASALANALRKTGQDAPLILQAAVASFMKEGFFESHLRKMRKLYGQKQALFVKLAETHLSRWINLAPSGAGMQLAGFYKTPIDQTTLFDAAKKYHLSLPQLNRFYLEKPAREGIYLGYAGIPLPDIEKYILQLKAIFSELES